MKIHQAQFITGVVDEQAILYDGTAQIAFIGRSNVGKSTTLNSLFGTKNLVKTGRTPGKTQEINFFKASVVVDDHEGSVYFVDIPGYGYAKHSKQHRNMLQERIVWYLTHRKADIAGVCMIIDAKAGITEYDRKYISILNEARRSFILGVNKIDKLNQKKRSMLMKEISNLPLLEGVPVVYFSAANKKYIDRLSEALGELLV